MPAVLEQVGLRQLPVYERDVFFTALLMLDIMLRRMGAVAPPFTPTPWGRPDNNSTE